MLLDCSFTSKFRVDPRLAQGCSVFRESQESSVDWIVLEQVTPVIFYCLWIPYFVTCHRAQALPQHRKRDVKMVDDDQDASWMMNFWDLLFFWPKVKGVVHDYLELAESQIIIYFLFNLISLSLKVTLVLKSYDPVGFGKNGPEQAKMTKLRGKWSW